jgi:hypothetical protein
MTMNPKAKWRRAKMQHAPHCMRRFVLNCPRGSIGPDLIAKAIALDCGSPATGRKLQMTTPGPDLKFARGLLTGDFHVAISDTIGIGRSTVRFATLRLKTRTDYRKPVCGVAREKRPRRFCI